MSASRPGLVARWSWLLVLVALAAVFIRYSRAHDLESAIRRDVAASGGKLADLPKSVPFPWSRVCIMGPGSDSKAAKDLLGFDWDADAHSDVRDDAGVVLLIFTHKNIVVGAVDYSRELGPWAGKCHLRDQARFALGTA